MRSWRTQKLVVFVVVLGLTYMPPVARAQSVPSTAVVTASARGEGRLVPDRATVDVTVETRSTSAAAAVKANASKQNAVISSLRSLGLAKSQVSTAGYAVTPEVRNDTSDLTPHIVSYLVSNSLSIEVSDLSLVGKVLDSVIAEGANAVGSMSLYTADPESAYQTALAVAVRNARSEASAIAVAAGGRLGPLLEIASTGGVQPAPAIRSTALMSMASAGTPIVAGEQTISASVTGRWVFIPDP